MLSPVFLGAANSGIGFTFSDSFATTLYTGTGTLLNVTTGIDSVNGTGLTWIKNRTDANSHILVDTMRGDTFSLSTDNTGAQATTSATFNSFNIDGFTVEAAGFATNKSGSNYVAWQFLEDKGFFDIVTYTGTGVAQSIPHNLDAEVGFMVIKATGFAASWAATHKSLATGDVVFLDTSTAVANSPNHYPNHPTTTNINVGTDTGVNANTENYVAYLFAHNPSKGVFCGSYTGNATTSNIITTGFPVGWVLIKEIGNSNSWYLVDIERSGNFLQADTSSVESTALATFQAEGFTITNAGVEVNRSGGDYIFMAIADPTLF